MHNVLKNHYSGFADPKENVKQFGIREGMHVADIGAGSGFYIAPIAKFVGRTGKVYAIDVQKELLHGIKADAKREGFGNVEIIWGDAERKNGTKLKDKSVDAIMLSNVLFQAKDKLGLISECKRILKEKGKVLLIDWTEPVGKLGPHPKDIVSKDKARDLFEMKGFVYAGDISAGSHHYGIIFSVAL